LAKVFIVRVNRDGLEKGTAKQPILVTTPSGHCFDAAEVSFPNGARLVYDPENPLLDGTRVWIEAPAAVVVR
jgi:hypothetical protein